VEALVEAVILRAINVVISNGWIVREAPVAADSMSTTGSASLLELAKTRQLALRQLRFSQFRQLKGGTPDFSTQRRDP
jgi:hypothetical protein